MVRFAALSRPLAVVRERPSRPYRADPSKVGQECRPGTGPQGASADAEPHGGSPDPEPPGASADPEAHRAATDPEPPGPSADPLDDADALDELGDEIATLAAHIHAAEHRLLTLIAEFDRREGWRVGGYASCADWLAARTRLNPATAREKVRAARALEGLPETSASMARGELSLCAVRALTRVATPENEAELLEAARGCTVAQIERMVRAWRRDGPADEAERERARWQERSFSVFPDEDGMYVVKGVLPPEVAAVLMKAVEAAGDALWREERERVTGLQSKEERSRAAAQRRADAVGLLAERALAAGFGRGVAGGDDGGAGEGHGRADEADGGTDPDVPISGSRAERYQVMLHVEAEELGGTRLSHETRGATLDDGTRLSHETSRRLSCDASLVRVTRAPRPASAASSCCGATSSSHARPHILDVGRRTRTIPPALRRALHVRDQGCRFPGCGLRFTDGHHLVHWADGGETSLRNCVLLCRHHHGLVHEGGWTVAWWGEGRPVFHDPRGGAHYDGGWEAPELPDAPVARLLDDNASRGVRPDGWTAGARWERERDVPWTVAARFQDAAAR